MSNHIHNFLIDYYKKAHAIKEGKVIHKESIVRQTLQRKTHQPSQMSPIEDFLRNEKQIAADSDPLEFRSLPRRLKVYFPGPPNPPPKLQQVPYTYEIVPLVPVKLPKQKPGYVGDWVLEQSYFPTRTNQSMTQHTTQQKYQHKDLHQRNQKFRSQLKKIAKVMKDENLTIKQVIKNKGLLKKSYNYYNSYDFFDAVKKNHKSCENMLENNPYLAYDVDEQKMTALHWAAREGHTHLAKILLQRYKANPNARDIYLRTPLHMAVIKKKPECVIRIYIEGGDLNCINKDKKSVRMVAEDSYIKYLLQKLQQCRYLVKTKGLKNHNEYREQLQNVIKSTLDESSLYF